MAKLTYLEHNIQVLEAAFSKGREVRHDVLSSEFPNFQIIEKIENGVFRMECYGREMIFPRDFNPEVNWYIV